MHHDLLIRYINVQTVLLSPICSHVCEHIWRNLLGNSKSIFCSSWPELSRSVDDMLSLQGKHGNVAESFVHFRIWNFTDYITSATYPSRVDLRFSAVWRYIYRSLPRWQINSVNDRNIQNSAWLPRFWSLKSWKCWWCVDAINYIGQILNHVVYLWPQNASLLFLKDSSSSAVASVKFFKSL